MQVMVLSEKITRIRSKILILGFFEDERPIRGYAGEIDWITNGAVSLLIRQNKIRGVLGETTLLATAKIATPQILMVGLGPKKYYNRQVLSKLSSHVLQILSRLKVCESAAVELWGQEACDLDPVQCLEAFFRGFEGNASHLPVGEQPFQLILLTQCAGRVGEMTRRTHEYQQKWAAASKPKTPFQPSSHRKSHAAP